MNQPYHKAIPNYEERMRIIAQNALSWYRVMQTTPVFTLSHH